MKEPSKEEGAPGQHEDGGDLFKAIAAGLLCFVLAVQSIAILSSTKFIGSENLNVAGSCLGCATLDPMNDGCCGGLPSLGIDSSTLSGCCGASDASPSPDYCICPGCQGCNCMAGSGCTCVNSACNGRPYGCRYIIMAEGSGVHCPRNCGAPPPSGCRPGTCPQIPRDPYCRDIRCNCGNGACNGMSITLNCKCGRSGCGCRGPWSWRCDGTGNCRGGCPGVGRGCPTPSYSCRDYRCECQSGLCNYPCRCGLSNCQCYWRCDYTGECRVRTMTVTMYTTTTSTRTWTASYTATTTVTIYTGASVTETATRTITITDRTKITTTLTGIYTFTSCSPTITKTVAAQAELSAYMCTMLFVGAAVIPLQRKARRYCREEYRNSET